jgi:hypothetical protein
VRDVELLQAQAMAEAALDQYLKFYLKLQKSFYYRDIEEELIE